MVRARLRVRARVRFIIAFFVGDLDDDDLQKTTKIEKKISNKKTQERRRERKKEEKKKRRHIYKTELLCVFFFFFCKVRFPKAWGCLRFTSAATEYLFSRKSSGKCRDEVKHKKDDDDAKTTETA